MIVGIILSSCSPCQNKTGRYTRLNDQMILDSKTGRCLIIEDRDDQYLSFDAQQTIEIIRLKERIASKSEYISKFDKEEARMKLTIILAETNKTK